MRRFASTERSEAERGVAKNWGVWGGFPPRRFALGALAVLLVGVLAGGWTYHRARAQVSEHLADLGAQMMFYADARNQDAPRELVVNGETVRFSSGTADRPLDDVLDHFEARCADVDGGLSEQLAELRREHPERLPARETPTLRENDAQHGFVACLDLGQRSMGATELAERIGRFAHSGNVSDIGEVRYVYAEGYEHDGHPRTHFVAMWTSGPFRVGRMFPERGDAPGREVPGLARPPGARRVLSGWERGEPHTLTVYESRMDEARLAAHYRDALEQSEFTLLTNGEHPGDGARTLIAERGERMVSIVVTTNLETRRTSAAVFDTR